MFKSVETIRNRNREIDRSLGRHAETLSRFLWPWKERWLLVVVGALSMFDFTSTYAILDLSGKKGVYESGIVASWALENGGFPLLFAADIANVAVLAFLALVSRYAYTRHGHSSYGRAAYIFVLTPYAVTTAIAIVNNIINITLK